MILNGIFIINRNAAGVPKSPTSSPQFPQVQSQRCYLFQLYITPRCSNTPLSHGVTITITQQLLWLRHTVRSRIQYRKHCLIGAAALWQPHSESFPLQTATFSPIPRILRAGARCLNKKKNDRPALLFRIYCNLCLYTLACVQSVWLEMAVSCPHMCKHVGVFLWRRSKKECVCRRCVSCQPLWLNRSKVHQAVGELLLWAHWMMLVQACREGPLGLP